MEKLTRLEYCDFAGNEEQTLHEQAAAIIQSPIKELTIKLSLNGAALDLDQLEKLVLDLHDLHLSARELRWLEKQTRLKELMLCYPKELLEGFGKIPSLEKLDLRNSKVDRLPDSIGDPCFYRNTQHNRIE